MSTSTSWIGEIAYSAEEQNIALTEVNTAVSHMDQMTQQNAAMAQQANAAVGSMKQQMKTLSDALDSFKIARGTQAVAASRPRRAA